MTLFRKQPLSDFMEAADANHTWQHWFEYFGPSMLCCARQWTKSLADAEDVVQEAFVRYWRHQRQLPGDPKALLITSIRRAALDQGRRDSRRQAREEAVVGDLAESAGCFEPQPGDDAERRSEIEDALRQLAPEQREVLVLKIWSELTFEQIAATLGISPNTAASRYRYALAALRKILTPVCHG